jgi:uncharacterized Zn finger protein (UPF0148 family)
MMMFCDGCGQAAISMTKAGRLICPDCIEEGYLEEEEESPLTMADITQADRDAFAKSNMEWAMGDENIGAEIIAAHREAHEAPLKARIAELDKALRSYPLPEDYDRQKDFNMAVLNWRKLADAALKGQTDD